MKSIKDLVPAAVEMYGEEMSKRRDYRELNEALMDKIADTGKASSIEQSNELFEAYVALIGYVERYFYEKGLRDGAFLNKYFTAPELLKFAADSMYGESDTENGGKDE